MKKIFLILIILILIGCEDQHHIEKLIPPEAIEIRWGDGTLLTVNEVQIIENVGEILTNAKLVPDSSEEFSDFLYDFHFDTITIINGSKVSISGISYTLTSKIKNALEDVLEEYIPIIKDGKLVNSNVQTVSKKDIEVETEVFEDYNPFLKPSDITDFDINDYIFLGALVSDGTGIYYHLKGEYNSKEIIDKIIIRYLDNYTLYDISDSLIPKMSLNQDKFMFVHDVGDEQQSNIVIYENQFFFLKTVDYWTDKDMKAQTIIDAIWYDDNTAIIIIGDNNSSDVQGGDIFFLDLETNVISKLFKSIDKHEFISIKLKENKLEVVAIHFLSDDYEQLTYVVDISEYEKTKPFTIKLLNLWEPWNLDIPRFTSDEITNLPLFNPNRLEKDVSQLEHNSDGGEVTIYYDGNINYLYTKWLDKIWRLDIKGKIEFETPRDIKVGQTIEEVLNKFPHEKNWKVEIGGEIYGLAPTSYKDVVPAVTYISNQFTHQLLILTYANEPTMKIFFENGVVIKIEVYYYIST